MHRMGMHCGVAFFEVRQYHVARLRHTAGLDLSFVALPPPCSPISRYLTLPCSVPLLRVLVPRPCSPVTSSLLAHHLVPLIRSTPHYYNVSSLSLPYVIQSNASYMSIRMHPVCSLGCIVPVRSRDASHHRYPTSEDASNLLKLLARIIETTRLGTGRIY